MERLEENQRPALVFTLVLTIVVILASEFLTRATATSTAEANQLYWLIDRSAGITAYELLALSNLLGLSMTMGAWDRFGMRKWAKQLHQYTTLLVLPFIGLHLFGLFQDTSVPFDLAALFVPMMASHHPLLSGLGTLTVYAVLLLIVTSYIRQRISVKAWRRIHFLAFPTFLMVTIHGFGGGSDSHSFIGYLMYGIPMFMVAVMSILRIQATRSKPQPKAPAR